MSSSTSKTMKAYSPPPETKKPVHIAILPGAGVGHLNPMLEFTKRLIQLHPNSFSITFIIIIPSSSSESTKKLSDLKTSFLSTLPPTSTPNINFLSLPPPRFKKDDFSTFPEEMVARVYLSIKRSLPPLRDLLTNLGRPVSSLVVDMFGTQAIEVALELGIEPYVCFQSSAMGLALLLHLPEMDRTVSGDFVDMAEPVKLEGCVPIPGKDLPQALLVRKATAYGWILEHSEKYGLAKGVILNSFDALEAGTIAALRSGDSGFPLPVYPIGPLTKTTTVATDPVTDDDDGCLKWLDGQPPESVLFINFGSGGTLSQHQMHEIASGLEVSGEQQRFIWVVRIPNDETSSGTYLGIDGKKDPLKFLPDGFLERTSGYGLVVPNWAPQVQILSHGSTGGFLTHCGWNSILEGVASGVPFIAWPLFAEQNLNAVFVEEGLKVAMRVRADTPGGLVGREQIARLVRGLMIGDEGKEMRRKMKGMKVEAEKAMGEENGSSKLALVDLGAELLKSGGQRN